MNESMQSRLWIQVLCFLMLVICLSGCHSARHSDVNPIERPNILILLADDLGYGELGCYGQEIIKTPNIDQLAKRGMRFTQFYAGSSVCSPSRAVLMTGMHVGRLSIRGNYGYVGNNVWGRISLDRKELTLGEMLRDAGYQTAYIGKWHLGIPGDISTWAAGRGFEYAVQEQWGAKPEGGRFDENDHWINGRDSVVYYDYTQYDCKDVFRTDLAIDFLTKERNSEKPLFLVMSYRTPHAHEYDLRETKRYSEFGWPENERRHASRITMLDEQVQRLLDTLEAMGEMDNTLVLFTSDNGPQAESHNAQFFMSAGGLRGIKRDMYEGGIRVPMIAYWYGKIEAGTLSDHAGVFYDLMPTLAEVSGIKKPAQTDGISFLPELLGQEQERHEHLYFEIQEGKMPEGFRQALRNGPWKVTRYERNGLPELYNLESDLYEKVNLAGKKPELLEELNATMLSKSKANKNWPYAGLSN
jgi:arylsulfatase A-like enzyme